MFTSVEAESDTVVVFVLANVAVSDGLSGTLIGVQSAAVFQSPEPGLVCHVALPARLVCAESRSNSMPAGRRKARARRRKNEMNGAGNEQEECVLFSMSFCFRTYQIDETAWRAEVMNLPPRHQDAFRQQQPVVLGRPEIL